MGLERVGDLAIEIILKKLEAEEIGRVACVSKRLCGWASEESVWRNVCLKELGLTEAIDDVGTHLPSFKACYYAWRVAFVMYPWPLVIRVKRCWDAITLWLAIHFPEALPTLSKGASEPLIQHLEDSLNLKLPLPTRILFRFHDGQDPQPCAHSHTHISFSFGLIGGYSFYTHFVNVFLLPIRHIILQTHQIRGRFSFLRPSNSNYLLLASSPYYNKFFFLNCSNGQLYVGTRGLTEADILPCVPHHLISLHSQDAFLLWLEEHGRRLHNGFIRLSLHPDCRSINLFPQQPPFCSTSVSNGVKVRASALFIPELSDPQNDHDKYYFSYSIRLSLQPQGCIINGMSFSSCQLHWRHWIIRSNDTVLSDVNGEAVVGQFPILRADAQEFVYQSCTPLPTSSGSIEGSFTFIPGRLTDPKGDPFLATVACFPLQLPDYIF